METCFWLLFPVSWAQLGLINKQNMSKQNIGKEESRDTSIQFLYDKDDMKQKSCAIEFGILRENIET